MQKLSLHILLLIFLVTNASAQKVEILLELLNTEDRVAMDGYDPVSYFIGTPKEGDEDISTTQQGIIYYFSSKANRDLFIRSPEKYTPVYGGWCAYAMGNTGETVVVDPETFKIIDGKLYLFYNRFFNNTLESWNEDEQNLKRKADANWNKLINQKNE